MSSPTSNGEDLSESRSLLLHAAGAPDDLPLPRSLLAPAAQGLLRPRWPAARRGIEFEPPPGRRIRISGVVAAVGIALLLMGFHAGYRAWNPSGNARHTSRLDVIADHTVKDASTDPPHLTVHAAAPDPDKTAHSDAEDGHTSCRDAALGSECFRLVTWAKTKDIYQHPDLYDGLTHESSFDHFQAHFFKNGKDCSLPCSLSGDLADTAKFLASKTTTSKPPKKKVEDCEDALPGQQCFVYVMWAKRTGIWEHPKWYKGLTNRSSFEEYQALLAKEGHGACGKPCNSSESIMGRSPWRDISGAKTCSNAEKGDQCHQYVKWAMDVGVKAHPEWYSPLNGTSSFKEFQILLHDEGHGGCDLPCVPKPATTTEVTTTTETTTTPKPTKTSTTRTTTTLSKTSTSTGTTTSTRTTTTATTTSLTTSTKPLAESGGSGGAHAHAHEAGTGAGHHASLPHGAGAAKHSTATDTTTSTTWTSTQTSTRTTTHTSTSTRTTTSTVTSTSTRTSTSSTSTITTSTTTTPCVPKRNTGTPSLFCYSVMQLKGIEVKLLKTQWHKRQSIFDCDDFAVISAEKRSLGKDECGNHVWTWVNDLPSVPMGKLGGKGVATSSYLNTETFIWAWDTLMNSGKLWKKDFAVKVDPDCVFFPDRLRQHLALSGVTGKPSYLLNCKYKFQGKAQAKIFGALEVFSVPALQKYQENTLTCKNMDWEGWGEDLYMEQCMKLLEAKGVEDFELVGDSRCNAAPCSDISRVAYHPFKEIDDYEECWLQSRQADGWVEPLPSSDW